LLTVTFYANVNGGGATVGVGAATVSLGTSGALPDVAVLAAIKTVTITAGQQAMVGQLSDLQFTTQGDGGVLVPVSPSSALFSVTMGGDKLQFVGGQAQGLLPGDAIVVAQVDGVSSAPTSVHVGSNAVVTVSPNPATVSINSATNFSAQVSNASNQAVTWSVVEGTAGGTIDANGHYVAPATPGTYHVKAVSQYDTDKSVVVTVMVQAGNVNVGGSFPPSGNVGVSIN
jgi:hypothetical protein